MRSIRPVSVSTCEEDDASQDRNGDGDYDHNMEVIDLNNDDEVEISLSRKDKPNNERPASKFFTSVASAIFPAETNDYFEKEDKASLPSKKDIDDNKSTYSVSNNTFTTFFRNLDVVVNEGGDASTCKPEAELKMPSVHDRKRIAATPKQVSDITMSMHPTKLGGDNGDDEGTYTPTLTSDPTAPRPLTGLPLLGLNDGTSTFSASHTAGSRSSRSSSRNSQSHYSRSTATSYANTDDSLWDKAVVEPKKKSGIFKFFGKKAHKSEPTKDEPGLREVSQDRSSFLDDMASSVENSTFRSEEDTLTLTGEDGSKKTLESKVSARSKKSTKSTPRPPLPPSIREGADPLQAPWSQVEPELEKQGSKSGKSFSACSAELDAISTFSKSTYHDQTDDLPVVYRENEIESIGDKGKVSSLLSAYLSLGSKEDAANVAQQAKDVEHNVPPASSSVHPEDKSHYSRKSSKSRASHRSMPSQKSHQSRSRSAGRSSHRSQPSQKSHRSQSRSRSAIKLRRVGEEFGLEDVLALSEEEMSVKSSATGTRSRMSVNKGLRRQDGSIKRGGSSVRDGSNRSERITMYSTQTDRTQKIDNTSITKLPYAEKAAAIKQNDTNQSSVGSTQIYSDHLPAKKSRPRAMTNETPNETVSTRGTNFTSRTGRTGRSGGTFNTLMSAEQASIIKKEKLGDRALQAVFLDEQSTFSHSTAPSTKHAKQSRNNADLSLTCTKTRTMSTRGTRQTGPRHDNFTLGSGTESKSSAGSVEYKRGATLAQLLKTLSEEQLEKLDDSTLGARLEEFLDEQVQNLEDRSVALGDILKNYSDVEGLR